MPPDKKGLLQACYREDNFRTHLQCRVDKYAMRGGRQQVDVRDVTLQGERRARREASR